MNPILYTTPLITALVGYATNWIAIVMLFRPYKEVKLGSIKLLGKGVIPQNQNKIAKSIGKTVSSELFSTNDLVDQIHSDEIQDLVQKVVRERIDSFLNRELTDVNALIPKSLQNDWDKIKEHLLKIVATQIHTWTREENFYQKFETSLISLIKNFSKKKIVVNENLIPDFNKLVNENFADIWSNFINEDAVSAIVKTMIQNFSKNENSLKSILPESFNDQLFKFEKTLTEQTASGLVEVFSSEDLVETLQEKLKEGITAFIEGMNLGMFASFLPMESILEKMDVMADQISDQIKDYILSENGKDRIQNIIHVKLEDFLAKPISEIMGFINISVFDSLEKSICKEITDSLNNEDFLKNIKNSTSLWLRSKFMNLDFAELLDSNKEKIANLIVSNVKQSDLLNETSITNYVSNIWDEVQKRKIGKLQKFITSEQKIHIENIVLSSVHSILEKNLPNIFHSIDIEEIVCKKVSEFPLEKLESIIRNVAHRELRYITIFGGILGFIAGLIQLGIYTISP